jgi:uncharacterized protein YndB with AHSA1/START domain
MADILQDLPVRAPAAAVFRAVSTPAGLDTWWTERSSGEPTAGAVYDLHFGPGYHWQARVTRCTPDSEFELQMTRSDADWDGTRVTFHVEDRRGTTWLRFSHTGWPEANEHYRISCHCWAMYLRILRRHLEHREAVAYDDRLDA